MTLTWSICSGRPAGARSRRPEAAGQEYAGALGASPADPLKHDAGAAADHDDGLPGQFRLALAGSGSHDSSSITLSPAGPGPAGRSRDILRRSEPRSGRAAVRDEQPGDDGGHGAERGHDHHRGRLAIRQRLGNAARSPRSAWAPGRDEDPPSRDASLMLGTPPVPQVRFGRVELAQTVDLPLAVNQFLPGSRAYIALHGAPAPPELAGDSRRLCPWLISSCTSS